MNKFFLILFVLLLAGRTSPAQDIFNGQSQSRIFIQTLSDGNQSDFIDKAQASWDNKSIKIALLTIPSAQENTAKATTLVESITGFIPNEQLFVSFSETVTEVQLSYYALNLFTSVAFNFDSYELSQESKELLTKLANFWKNRNQLALTISAHTDSKGNPDYNRWLSEQRANSVVEYLKSQGVSVKKENIKVNGAADLKLPETLPKASTVNRRVDIFSF